ncbi:hypothetical protein BZG04_11115 [Salinivibrio kushneri]|uniref:YagK/YfjJ C-terminal domain-containing protein n=1 Tax=Salinivibrio kushneri TaxID=1908198 RepID=A0AB36K800_9GAMM|nr:inovirus-type Gp2 protein [Salinivibrio kushneri]OOE34674.1 hypothetical protein BZG04_11115 [Salinivibrio kushneri]OOE44955.1 hypothetical protein BZG09_05715 [Salinivibrio kushneri]
MPYSTNTGFFKTKDGRCWEVNTGPNLSPLYTDILQRLVGQLEAMESHYARVFCFRFDLHLTEYTDNSTTVSRLFSLVVQALKRRYKTPNIGYLWVREHEKAKQQHYHCVLLLDGSKVNHFHTTQTTIDDYWAAFEGGHVQGCGFKVLPRGSSHAKAEIIYWLSYLAKVRGKASGRGKRYRPSQTKRYGVSRVKIKAKNCALENKKEKPHTDDIFASLTFVGRGS